MGVREALRDVRAFREPFILRDDDGVVSCASCGTRVDCRDLRVQGWVALLDGEGNHRPLCPACSRREIGRYTTFLFAGRNGWAKAWHWIPVAVLFVAMVRWGDDLMSYFVVGNDVSVLIVGACLVALGLGVLKVYELVNLFYARRRILAWRHRLDTRPSPIAEVAES